MRRNEDIPRIICGNATLRAEGVLLIKTQRFRELHGLLDGIRREGGGSGTFREVVVDVVHGDPTHGADGTCCEDGAAQVVVLHEVRDGTDAPNTTPRQQHQIDRPPLQKLRHPDQIRLLQLIGPPAVQENVKPRLGLLRVLPQLQKVTQRPVRMRPTHRSKKACYSRRFGGGAHPIDGGTTTHFFRFSFFSEMGR